MISRSYQTHAVVLRARNLGEADKIFTLFTQEQGKIDAIGKSVRRPKSRICGKLEFGAEVALLLNRGRTLDVITGAEIVHSRWSSITDPASYGVAHLMVELVDALCEPALAIPEIYDLLNGALRALERRRRRAKDPALLIPRFEARMLVALGVAPYDQACVQCGGSLEEKPAWANLDAGGLCCEGCRPRRFDTLVLQPREVANFRSLGASRVSPQGAVLAAAPAAARAIEAFLAYHLGKYPRARRLLEELRAPGGIEERSSWQF